jgi:hypothetical protein
MRCWSGSRSGRKSARIAACFRIPKATANFSFVYIKRTMRDHVGGLAWPGHRVIAPTIAGDLMIRTGNRYLDPTRGGRIRA